MVKVVGTYQTREIQPRIRLLIEVEQETVQYRNSEGIINSFFDGEPEYRLRVFAHHRRDRAGWHTRGFYVRWVSDPPSGYDSEGGIWIPIPRANLFDRTKLGDIGTYKGKSCILVGKRTEAVRS